MVIYYFILTFLPFSLLASIVRERLASTSVLLLLAFTTILISALRWEADIDHPDYINMFADNPTLENLNSEAITELYGEPGYLFTSAIFKSLGIDFAVMSAACAFFSVAIKAWVLNKFTKAASLALSLYLCIHFVTIEFIQIRWAIASAFICLAIYFQAKKKHTTTIVFFVLAISFHYFSLAFLFVSSLVEIRIKHLLMTIFVAGSALGLLLALEGFVLFSSIESELYIVRRTVRYLNEPISDVGFLSYARLAMIPIAFQIMVIINPELLEDATIVFLRKVAYASLTLTMLVSFVPLMHFRAVVIADIFSLALITRSLDFEKGKIENFAIVSVITTLYAVWFIMDVSNYVTAERLFPYQTWFNLYGGYE